MKSRAFALGICLMLLSASGRAQRSVSLAIQPLGDVDPALMGSARDAIAVVYGVGSITILPALPLPKSAFYEPGKRYRAEKLLEHLDSLRTDRYSRIVGLTAVDISTTKGQYYDWGIFGMANLINSACVVSTCRLGKGKVSDALFNERFRKVVIHEVGHTFSLPHCTIPGCIMNDAAGSIGTIDRSGGKLCSWCRRHLRIW